MSPAIATIGKVIHDYLTGLDGESYALGKAFAVVMIVAGLPLPYIMLVTHATFTLAEAGIYYGALGGAVMALVWGTNPAEPKAPPVPSSTITQTTTTKETT